MKDFEERFGSLFEGLKTERVMELMSTFFFVARRLIVIIAAIVMQDYPSF